MATQTTGGGSTTSFTNTPQANDDTYNYLEDLLRNDATIYNVATNTVTLDVMSNDLGGNAKALFSVEDGDGNALTADFDLLAKDVNAAGVSPWEETLNHNWVRINNGKIEYRIADGSGIPGQGRSVDSLTAGENFNDQFVYAIRLGNGTLSEATVKIHITGANDAATIGVVGASDNSVTEAGGVANAIPGDPSAGGTLVVNDADLGDNKFQAPSASSLNGTYGTFTFNPTTGVWAYTLDNNRPATQALAAGAAVTETLTVTSFDGTATYNIVVNVHGTNDNPVAVADTGGGTENQVLTIDVLANDTDVDTGHSFTVTNVSVPAGQGSVSIVGNQLRFDPGTDFDHLAQGVTATVTVNYTMQDEHGASSSSTATITVTGTNDGPTANADVNGLDVVSESGVNPGNSAFPGDPSASGNVLANDTDPDDGAVLTVKDVNGAAGNVGTPIEGTYGSITINADGTWSYALNNADSDTQALAQDAHVTESFSYTVKDEWGATSTATLTISITGTNDAPDLSASVTSGSYTDTAADDTFGNVSGTLSTVDPDTGDTAAYSVAGGVADGSLLGYDMSKASAYGTLYLNSTSGAYRFVPNDAAIEGLKTDDSVAFTLTVTDGHGATDSETLTINIDGANDTPELSASLTAHTYVDTSGDDSFAAVNGTLSTTDRDSGDSAAYSVAGGVADVSLAGYDHSASSAYGTLYLNSSSGAYTFVPNDGAIEGLKTDDSAVFTLTVTDGSGATDSETLTITLDGANDTPDLGAVTDASYNDTAADDSFAPVNGTLTSSDRDTGDSATYSVGGQVSDNSLAGYDRSASSAYGTLYLNSSSGAYVFVPNDAAIEGLKTTDHVDFTVTVTDGDGASDSDTLTITLNGVNDTPEAAATNSVTTDEDVASSAVAIGASDRDAGEVLTYSVKTGEAPGHGSVSFDQGAGTFVYTPTADYNGSDSFTILVTDASGGTTEQVVSVTINAVADIVGDSASTNEDTGVTTNVLLNDTFEGTPVVTSVTQGAHGSVAINGDNTVTYTPNADYNGSDSYTYTVTSGGVTETATVNVTINPVADIADDSDSTNEDTAVTTNVLLNDSFEGTPVVTSVTQGAHGSVAINADNTVTYTPNADYNGSDSYTYTVTSGGVTETATVNVTINPVADIADDSDSTNEDTAVTTNVLLNDSFEGTPVVTSVTQGAHGSVAINGDNTVTYTPNADYNGSDSYTYTVTSGGVTETATVNVTINPVADIADDSDSTNEDTAVTTNVLLNDSFEDAGAAVTGVTQGAHGSVTINGDGTVTYTPNADYNGSDSYTYTVTSGGVTETATVNVTINAVADIVDDGATTNEDTAVTTNVLLNDTFEGTPSVTGVTQGAHGSVANNGDGTVTYTPNADYNGPDSYTYTVTSGGVTETATVNVTINPVNDAPVGVDDTASTDEDTPLTMTAASLVGNDTDVDIATNGQVLSISAVTDGAHGTAVLNGDGSVTYTPDANFNGTDTITYTVSDGHGGTDTADVVITVNPVNDNPVAVDDTGAGLEDTTINGSVAGNDSDVDGDSLTYAVNGSAPAGFSLDSSGSWTLDATNTAYQYLAAGETADVTVGYTVSDGNGGSDVGQLVVTVTGVNDAPTLAKDANGWSYDAANGHYYMVVNSGSITFDNAFAAAHAAGGYLATIANSAENLFIAGLNPGIDAYIGASDAAVEGTFRWIDGPEQGQLLSYTNWSGGEPNNLGNEDYVHVHGDPTGTWNDIAGTNPGVHGYVVERNGDLTVMEVSDGAAGENVLVHAGSGSLSFTDVDTSDSHSASFVPAAGGYVGTFNVSVDEGADKLNWSFSVSDGALDHLAAGEVLTQSYTVTIDDGNGGTADQTIVVTMVGTNDAPTVSSAIADQSSAEDAAWSFAVPAGSFTDVDDGAVLSYSATLGNGNPLPSWLVFDASTQTFSGTPPLDFNGSIDLKVTASDGVASASDTFTLNITPVNDPAVLSSATVNLFETNAVLSTGGTLTISDVDSPATFQAQSNVAGSYGHFSIDAAGNWTYVANSAFNEINAPTILSDTFAVASADGTMTSVTVTIAGTNDSPALTGTQAILVGGTEDTSYTIHETDLLAGFSDIDGGTIRVSSLTAANGILTDNLDGTWTFAPVANFNGTVTLNYSVVDGQGGSVSANNSFTLAPVNDPATFSGNDVGAITEDDVPNVINGQLFAVDVDAGQSSFQPSSGTGVYGSFSINASGAWTYTLNNADTDTNALTENQPATDTFTVHSLDGTATSVTINITGNNDAPTITSDGGGASASFSIPENLTTVTTVTATDPDSTVTYSLSGADAAKFAITAGGVLTFVNAPDFENPTDADHNNSYLVTVTASDGALIDTQNLTVNITDVVEGPTRFAPTDIKLVPVVPNGAENFNQFDFSGTLSASDPDPGAMTFTITSQSDPGLFSISGNTLSALDIGVNKTINVVVRATQTGDPVGVFTEETFTVITGSNGNSGDPLSGVTGDDVLYGNGGNDILMGLGGNDTLFGQDGNDNLQGGDGNDVLNGGAGVDTLTGGLGNDTFVLINSPAGSVDNILDYGSGDTIDITAMLSVAGGTDVIGGGFLRVTTTGLIQVDSNGSAVGGQVWTTVGTVNTGAGPYAITYTSGGVATTVNVAAVAPPIALDMDGDGQVSFLATGAGATFDYGFGKVATAWVAGNDGILVRDANHDGQASANEIVFATSGSDLQGLAVYDSNHDGKLSSADAAFADFQVWQDANSNGVVDKGEMQSLTALGIASLSLSSDGITYSAAGGDVSVVGTGSYTRSDGSTGVLADAVFNTGAAAQQDQSRLIASNSNAALIGAIAAAGLAASEPLAAASVQGESHASAQVFGMPMHDGLELSPVAASAVATLQAAEQMAASNGHQGSPGETAPAAIATDGNAGLDSSADQAASTPADLLQATDAPAHEAIVSATPLAAPSIAMPSAEQLTAGATAEAAQHNQVVSQVLADALHGGAAQGPDIDGLLASLPHAPGLGEGLATHMGAAGFDGAAGFMLGPIAFSLETLATHMDAPAHG